MNEDLQRELAPPVTVKFADKEYSLIYDLRALSLYKKKTGHALLSDENGFAKIGPDENPQLFAAFLWAGMQRMHPEVDYEQVYPAIEEIPFGPELLELTTAVARAATAHFPRAKSPNAAAPAAASDPAPVEPAKAELPATATTDLPSSEPLPASILG